MEKALNLVGFKAFFVGPADWIRINAGRVGISDGK
jgi:hypothetical protein